MEQAVLGICSACRYIVMLCMNSGNFVCSVEQIQIDL